MLGFERKRSLSDFSTGLTVFKEALSEEHQQRYRKMVEAWNFYEGYHWESIPALDDSAQMTINYCRAFVDKFVAFEFGKAFSFTTHTSTADLKITPDGRTLFDYLEDVWEDNNQYAFCTTMGQMKSICGEAWVKVDYISSEDVEEVDPFNEYPEGRLVVNLIPSSYVFPEYDPHNKDRLIQLTIMYEYKKLVKSGISLFKTQSLESVLYKQVWTKDECIIIDGSSEPEVFPNKFGVIPFIQINNLPVAGKNSGRGDLDDIIPLNTMYNLKQTDVSEILDYHAAPVTIVYGAKIGNLEKGANKMWGGLAKDAKVQNLELNSDLGASSVFNEGLKNAMCEIGGIPVGLLGGSQAISNTSGVALQYVNLPLIEKTRVKRLLSEDGLERVNKLIILVSLLSGLITKPEGVSSRDFFHTEVTIPDTLPKDYLLELQQIQIEMQLGLENRKGALERLGRENIEILLEEIDKDRLAHPDVYMPSKEPPKLNSGMTNGETPIEKVRKEITGQNGLPNL